MPATAPSAMVTSQLSMQGSPTAASGHHQGSSIASSGLQHVHVKVHAVVCGQHMSLLSQPHNADRSRSGGTQDMLMNVDETDPPTACLCFKGGPGGPHAPRHGPITAAVHSAVSVVQPRGFRGATGRAARRPAGTSAERPLYEGLDLGHCSCPDRPRCTAPHLPGNTTSPRSSSASFCPTSPPAGDGGAVRNIWAILCQDAPSSTIISTSSWTCPA